MMKRLLLVFFTTAWMTSGCSSVRSQERTRIADKIEARATEIRACYEKLQEPRPSGVVWVSFIFDSTGKVVEQSIGKSTLGVPPVETCILGVIRSIRFDPPLEQLPVQTNYPIHFGTKG